jgi:hypothetical protein
MPDSLENICISLDNASKVDHHAYDMYSTFASDIGLKPGYFPKHLDTILGNRQLFVFDTYIYQGEEIVGAQYQQYLGCISIVVYND